MTENTQMNYRTQVLDAARVFWQQHTKSDALSMTMAELHTDVELVIRAARGAAQAAPVDTLDHEECEIPPIGWRCTRGAGHGGPCAAVEAPEDIEFVALGMRRIRDAEDAERWRYAIADSGNRRMNWQDVYDDWSGEGEFADAIDAARAQEQQP